MGTIASQITRLTITLLNRLSKAHIKEASKLHVAGLC